VPAARVRITAGFGWHFGVLFMAATGRLKADRQADEQTSMPRHAAGRDSLEKPRPADAPDTFDEWLDNRLKVLYEAVLNEPLPPEMRQLLETKKQK
jgi:hypothetical protein